MNMTYVRDLHNRVIHIEKAKASYKAANAETKWIKLIKDAKTLISICKECFSDPT